MEEKDENISNDDKNQEVPAAHELLPDRDVLMMEKPMKSNRAAGYKPADKKLLRNISLIVLFLIALLVILMVIVRSNTKESEPDTRVTPREGQLAPGIN